MFTPAFTKLQRSILNSSIWMEDSDTRLVWIVLLALCDRDGIARISPANIAYTARVTEDGADHALQVLEAPDPESRNTDYEGRRIRRVEGGYEVLNYTRYLNESSAGERREYFRQKKAESRARQRAGGKTIRPEHRDDRQAK